jgi:hypothetical protein
MGKQSLFTYIPCFVNTFSVLESCLTFSMVFFNLGDIGHEKDDGVSGFVIAVFSSGILSIFST